MHLQSKRQLISKRSNGPKDLKDLQNIALSILIHQKQCHNQKKRRAKQTSEDHSKDTSAQIQALWSKKACEIVIAVIQSNDKKRSYTLHHSELKTLQPHKWLVGEYLHAASSQVFVVDPAGHDEGAKSMHAASRFREYFKMRRNCLSKNDWVDIKWQGGQINHSTQQDGYSCGVLVMQDGLPH